MNSLRGQGNLFPENTYLETNDPLPNRINLSKTILEAWQKRIHDFQYELFQSDNNIPMQGSFFKSSYINKIDHLKPMELAPLPINFWRQQKSPHHGPAIYLVMDRPRNLDSYILLYVGETIAAQNRWKNYHDCKSYLDAYNDALGRVDLKSQISIRFWTDVPRKTTPRRKLEQILINRWLPPFNKESRGSWNTPFTSEIN